MASQSIMSLTLKVEVNKISYELTQQGPEVELHLSDQSSILVDHLKAITLQSCLPKEILQSYTVIGAFSKWTFSHKYVLSDINHTPLLDFLASFLENFIICLVKYQVPQLQKPVEEMINDMEDQKEIVLWNICKGNNNFNELFVLASKGNNEIIRNKFERLKEYREEVLIYPLDDYLQKSKLKATEYQLFLKGLLRLFEQAIMRYVSKRMKKVHMHQDLNIKRVTWMGQELQKSSKINMGVVFEVVGFGQKLGKLYQFVERWFEKINWIMLEVEQIECCKRDKVEDWLWKNRKAQAVLVSPRPTSNNQEERVVVFQPPAEKPQLENDLLTAVRIISGREFCKGNSRLEDHFHLIFKYQSDFKKFMMGQKGGQSNLDMKIYQQYVLVSCDRMTELKVRKKISEFLQLYQEEEVHIQEFKSAFHIVIFKHYYSSMIRTKPIKIELIEGKLFRCNSKQKSQQVQNQIKDIYRAMRKQLVYKPISRPLSHKIEEVQVSLAPWDWTTTECLQSRRYKLTDKLSICLRSYGSISNSDQDCIFLVDNFERCVELKQILEEEEVSSKFESLLKKNKKMSIPLRYCRYFDNITVWLFEKEHYRQKRNGVAGTKLKNDIEGLLESCSNPLQLQLMLPSGSEGLVETLLPTLLEILLDSCSFDSSKAKKEMTIYTSCSGGDVLRREIIQQLRRFNKQARVDRITDLDLRLNDLQKIVEYKYLELKYFDNQQTKCASPVNSYIFSRQILKKGKTPIFLPTQQEKTKYKEYLVSYFSSEVYQIQGDGIVKLKQKIKDIKELEVLVDLVKKYFPMLDYVVIFGDVERGVFSKRLVYTESTETMYKIFKELEIDLGGLKILCANNKVRLKYELNLNEFVQLYRVETHPKKAAELSQLKRRVLL